MTTYHIPAETLGTRQRRHSSGGSWETFVTTRTVTYGDKDIQLNSSNYLGFWIPDPVYWLVRFKRKDVDVI